MKTLFQACPRLYELFFLAQDGTEQIDQAALRPYFQRGLYTPHSSTVESGAAVLQTFLAASDVSRSIKRLFIEQVGTSCLMDDSGKPYPEVSKVMQSVELLWWGLGNHEYGHAGEYKFGVDDDTFEGLASGEMLSLLRCMRKLLKLSIIYRLENPLGHERSPPLHQLAGDITWPRLQSLQLYGFRTDPGELELLLFRHERTMKSLELADAHFTSGEWDQCFQRWSGKFGKLDRLELANAFTAAASQRLYYFGIGDKDVDDIARMLREGGKLPAKPTKLSDW